MVRLGHWAYRVHVSLFLSVVLLGMGCSEGSGDGLTGAERCAEIACPRGERCSLVTGQCEVPQLPVDVDDCRSDGGVCPAGEACRETTAGRWRCSIVSMDAEIDASEPSADQGVASADASTAEDMQAPDAMPEPDAFQSGTIERLEIDPSPVRIEDGQRAEIRVTAIYNNGFRDPSFAPFVTWSVADPRVATVELGVPTVLKALSEGQTILRAVFGELPAAETQIQVTAAQIRTVRLTPSPALVAEGSQVEFTVLGDFGTGRERPVPAEPDGWVVEPPGALNIIDRARGIFEGVALGPATVSARAGGLVTAPVDVVIGPAEVVSLELVDVPPTLVAGQEARITVVGELSNGRQANLTGAPRLVWATNAPDIADVVNPRTGLVRAAAVGPVTFTVQYLRAAEEALETSQMIRVVERRILQLTVSPDEVGLALGDETQLRASAEFNDGQTDDVTGQCAWSSGNDEAVTVGVTPENAGSIRSVGREVIAEPVVVTASFDGLRAQAVVELRPSRITGIRFEQQNIAVAKGRTADLQVLAETTLDGENHIRTEEAVFQAQSNLVAFDNPARPNTFTALEVGETLIEATLEEAGAVFRARVVVEVLPPELTELRIAGPSEVDILETRELQLHAEGVMSDGTTSPQRQVQWSSSAPNVARVSNEGVLEAESLGNTTIQARSGALNDEGDCEAPQCFESGVVRVHVLENRYLHPQTNAELIRIEVSPPQPIAPLGDNVTLTARGIYGAGDPVDLTEHPLLRWEVAEDGLGVLEAIVGAPGGYRTISAGSTTVTARFLEFPSHPYEVTVSPAELRGLEIRGSQNPYVIGQSFDLNIVGRLSDATDEDYSDRVSCTSTDLAILVPSLQQGAEIEAVGVGRAHLECTSFNGSGLVVRSNQITIDVVERAITHLEITTGDEQPIPDGATSIIESLQLTLAAWTVFNDSSREQVTLNAEWVSDDQNLLRLERPGVFNALARGTTGVSITYAGMEARVAVTVREQQVDDLTIEGLPGQLPQGRSLQLTARAILNNGQVPDVSQEAVWETTNEEVFIVTNDAPGKGRVTGVSPGTADLRVSYSGHTEVIPMAIVDPVVESIVIAPVGSPDGELLLGSTLTFSAEGLYSDGVEGPVDIRTLEWRIADGAIAEVAAGVVTGTGVGETLLTASIDGVNSAPATVRVLPLPNVEPLAHLACPRGGIVASDVQVDARGSSDPDGDIVEFQWDFGDGTSLNTELGNVSHRYTDFGQFLIRVVIVDSDGAEASAECSVVVEPVSAPKVAIHTPTTAQAISGQRIVRVAIQAIPPEGKSISHVVLYGNGDVVERRMEPPYLIEASWEQLGNPEVIEFLAIATDNDGVTGLSSPVVVERDATEAQPAPAGIEARFVSWSDPLDPAKVYFDATLSHDFGYGAASLEVRWDWDGDGSMDTDWDNTLLSTHVYANPGASQRVGMQIRNPDGDEYEVSRDHVFGGDLRVLNGPLENGAVLSGTYVVNDDITVPEGARVVIQAGTTLLFSNVAVYRIDVQGELIIDGEEDNPVVLTPDDAQQGPGAWSGIHVHQGAEPITMRNAYLKYAETAVELDQGTSADLSNVTIYAAEGHGLSADQAARVTLDGLRTIENGQDGISLSLSNQVQLGGVVALRNQGNGVSLHGSPAVFSGALVAGGNAQHGLYLSNTSLAERLVGPNLSRNGGNGILLQGSSRVEAHRGRLEHNGQYGILGADPDAPRSLLTHSFVRGNGAGGLSLQAGVELRDCKIDSNGGVGLFVNGDLLLARSTIISNEGDGVRSNAGAVLNQVEVVDNRGPGLVVNGDLQLEASLFSNNDGDGVQCLGNSRLTGVAVLNNGRDGIVLSGQSTVTGVYVADQAGDGLVLNDGGVTIAESRIARNGGVGLQISDGDAYQLTSLSVQYNEGSGIVITDTLHQPVLGSAGVDILNNGGDGVELVGDTSMVLNSAVVSHNRGKGIAGSPGNRERVRLLNVSADKNALDGIYLPAGGILNAVQAIGNGRHGIQLHADSDLSDTRSMRNGQDGLHLVDGVILAQHFDSRANGRYGLFLQGPGQLDAGRCNVGDNGQSAVHVVRDRQRRPARPSRLIHCNIEGEPDTVFVYADIEGPAVPLGLVATNNFWGDFRAIQGAIDDDAFPGSVTPSGFRIAPLCHCLEDAECEADDCAGTHVETGNDGLNRRIGNSGCLLEVDEQQAPTIHCIDAEPQVLAEIACGDGQVDVGETCDDANADLNDGCNAECFTECGDGVIADAEECDDGNSTSGDGCDRNCRLTGCGNGAISAGESCDGEAGCAANCTYAACGNGVVEGNEVCDDGDSIDQNACANHCQAPACGDGIVQDGEQCDDSNADGHDGCNNDCRLNFELFGILDARHCTTTVAYGPYQVGPNSDAYLSTVSRDRPHRKWFQIVRSANTELFRIEWTFDQERTLEEHLVAAINQGISVSWVVYRPNLAALNYQGTWRFSSRANRDDYSGVGFLSDNGGIFGAADGVVDGGADGLDGAPTWGVGNHGDGDDAVECGTLWSGGVIQGHPRMRTELFIDYRP